MPDLLTHYAISLLITVIALRSYLSVIIALSGLLPDIDAFLSIHRSPTHSLLLSAPITLISLYLYTRNMGNKLRKILFLTSTLYTLHILMDLAWSPTPILWPLTDQGYYLSIDISGGRVGDKISISASINLVTSEHGIGSSSGGPLIDPHTWLISLIIVFISLFMLKIIVRRETRSI